MPPDVYPVNDFGPIMKGLAIGGLGIFHVFFGAVCDWWRILDVLLAMARHEEAEQSSKGIYGQLL